jgi:flagellar hook-basal body complex protein FliE
MATSLSTISSALTPNSADMLAQLARASSSRYTASDGDALADGLSSADYSLAGLSGAGPASRAGVAGAKAGASASGSFEQAMLKALDGVSASQNKSDGLLQKVVADPDSVDAQDVTIAMAEANMSLNLAKTILSRVVTAWKDVINTR